MFPPIPNLDVVDQVPLELNIINCKLKMQIYLIFIYNLALSFISLFNETSSCCLLFSSIEIAFVNSVFLCSNVNYANFRFIFSYSDLSNASSSLDFSSLSFVISSSVRSLDQLKYCKKIMKYIKIANNSKMIIRVVLLSDLLKKRL